MPFAIGFRLLAHKDKGLRDAPQILGRNLRGGLEAVGKRLRTSAITRMRRDRGTEEKSLRIEVKSQGANAQLTVYSTLVQAFVDAYGLKPGHFPPFQPGSNVYRWAERKAKGIESKRVNAEGESSRLASHLSRRPKVKASAPTGIRQVKRTRRPSLTTGQRRRAKNGEAKRLAFLAARAIFEKGIRPTYWNQKALEANRARIIQELRNALSRAASEMSRG